MMTMKCPICGSLMIWLNGSISHDPPIKYYTCRGCKIGVSRYSETSYDMYETEKIDYLKLNI
jgi:transposase-like protein